MKKLEPKDAGAEPQAHTILILDKFTQILPIECLSALKGRSVSRLPCLSFLRDRVLYARSQNQMDDPLSTELSSDWSDIKVDGNSAFYVLNPSGDLVKTQAEFQSALEKYVLLCVTDLITQHLLTNVIYRRSEWHGTIGRPPMEQQIQNALKQKDIYM